MITDDDTHSPTFRQLKTCSGLAIASIVSGLTKRRELSIAATRFILYKTGKIYVHQKLYDQHEVEAMQTVANFVGALSAGLTMYLIGRKWSAVLVSLLFVLPLLVISSDYGPRTELVGVITFHVARTHLYAVYSVYAAEATAPKLRGPVFSLYFVGFKAGELVGALFEPGSKKLVMLALAVVLGALVMSLRAPETPHWLKRRGRHEEAARVFAWLRGDDTVDADELEAIGEKLEAPGRGVRAGVRAFFTPLVLFVGLHMAYADSCDLVQPSFDETLHRNGWADADELSGPVFSGLGAAGLFHYVGALLGSVATVGLCFVVGRRRLLLASVISGVAIFFVHLFTAVPDKVTIYVALCCDIFNVLGAEQVLMIMPAEIFPGTLRVLGVFSCEFMTLVIEFIMQSAKKKGVTSTQFTLYYYVRWILVPLGMALCLFFLPETKDLPLTRTEELGAKLKVQFVESNEEEPE